MKFNDAILGGVLLALSVAILVHIQGFPNIPGQKIGPGAFPGLIAAILAGCSVSLIWKGFSNKAPLVAVGAWLGSPRHVRNFLLTIGALVFYILAADKLGFLICGALILMALFSALQVRSVLAVPLAIALVQRIRPLLGIKSNAVSIFFWKPSIEY